MCVPLQLTAIDFIIDVSFRAVGAAYLARRKAIVQKLTAIESLAGASTCMTAPRVHAKSLLAQYRCRYALFRQDWDVDREQAVTEQPLHRAGCRSCLVHDCQYDSRLYQIKH